jgi:hypothetical protein
MLRGSRGIGWMILSWLALAVLIAIGVWLGFQIGYVLANR